MIARNFQALTFRNYRIFWFGQMISLIGSWMQSTILPFLAYELSNQPIYLGLIGFSSSIPALFFSLPAGVLIERVDKRKAVIVLQTALMLFAFIYAFLAFRGVMTIWHIIVISFLYGTTTTLEITARQSMLPTLVDREAIPNAIALNSTIFNLARVLGPTIAAPFLVLLSNNGEGWAFLVNGISFLFVIGGLFLINPPTHPQEHKDHHWLSEFNEGQRFIRKTPTIYLLILLVTIPSFFAFPFIQQIPVLARDVYATSLDTAGSAATRNSLMLTAQGVGALIAALLLSTISRYRKKLLLLTIGEFIFAGAIFFLSFTTNIYQALPLMALAGFGMVTQMTLTMTMIQITSPDDFRGRVISSYLWALQGVAPFGSLLFGWITQTWGVSIAIRLAGIVIFIGYSIIHFLNPFLRKTTT